MTVYIEYVVLDNFTIDSLLLYFAAITLRLRCKWYRIALGGAVGTACAAVSVYVTGAWLYVIKCVCVVLMCAVTVGLGVKLFWHILLTVAYTFVSGGAIIGLFHLFNVRYLTDGGQFYQTKVPLFVYVMGFAAAAFLCYCVVTYVRKMKKVAPYLCKVTLHLCKNVTVAGLCDSGNTITYNGCPVCFVSAKYKPFNEFLADSLLHGRTVQLQVNTVTGAGTSVAAKAKISVNGTQYDVYLATSASPPCPFYQIILSNQVYGGAL